MDELRTDACDGVVTVDADVFNGMTVVVECRTPSLRGDVATFDASNVAEVADFPSAPVLTASDREVVVESMLVCVACSVF